MGAIALAGMGLPIAPADDDPARPTFTRDIAPLVHAQCTTCHRPGGSGPFSLTTFADIKKRSRQIAEVVEERFMPPWKPDPTYGPALHGERRLTADQIDRFTQWHEAGAPGGDLTPPPSAPEPTQPWQLGPPDLILRLPAPYALAADGQDVFRNFVLPIPVTDTTYVRALEFLPEPSRVIHHAGIMTDQTGRARDRDAADAEQGFPSMDLGDFGNPDGHIIGWTPGQVPYETHPGTAWKLEPGTDLVVQLHLLPSGKPEAVAPLIGLYFTDTPPTRTTTVVQLRELSIDIPAGESAYRVEESLVIPVPTRVLRIFPHAHYLGKEFEVFAELPDGSRQPLLRIPDWDFNWQSDYTFAEPVLLPADSRLMMHLTYDNSAANPRNPSSPPQRVQWGWKSTDEMGGIVVQLLLEDGADLPRIHENLARYEIDRLGPAPVLFHSLADALIKQERADEAIAVLRQLLTLEPAYAPALRELATLLLEQEAWAEATASLLAYLQLHPQNQSARLALADAQIQQGQLPAAIATLETGLVWHDTAFAYLESLGHVYLETGDTRAALTQFERAIALPDGRKAPRDIQGSTQFKIAYLRLDLGDRVGAEAAVHRAVQLTPTHLGAGSLAAYLAIEKGDFAAATTFLRQVTSAGRYSATDIEAVQQRLPFPNGSILLAQVLAESGDLELARSVLTRAITLAQQTGDRSLESDLRGLIAELHPETTP